MSDPKFKAGDAVVTTCSSKWHGEIVNIVKHHEASPYPGRPYYAVAIAPCEYRDELWLTYRFEDELTAAINNEKAA